MLTLLAAAQNAAPPVVTEAADKGLHLSASGWTLVGVIITSITTIAVCLLKMRAETRNARLAEEKLATERTNSALLAVPNEWEKIYEEMKEERESRKIEASGARAELAHQQRLHKDQMEEIRWEYKEQTERMHAEHMEQMKTMGDQHAQQLEQIRTEYSAQMDEQTRQMECQSVEIEKLNTTITKLETQNKQLMKELKAFRAHMDPDKTKKS